MPIICQPLIRPNFFERRRLRAIYHANFAPRERKPFSYMIDRVREGDFVLLVARDTQSRSRIVSFALLTHLSDTSALYLGYLATDSARHSQGIGGTLFDALVDHAAALPGIDALIWEVDPPRPGEPNHVNNRRIRFYERHGAHVIASAATYRIPDDATGGTTPLRLMWCPVGQRTNAPPRDEIAAWIRAIFRDVYEDNNDLAAQIIAELA